MYHYVQKFNLNKYTNKFLKTKVADVFLACWARGSPKHKGKTISPTLFFNPPMVIPVVPVSQLPPPPAVLPRQPLSWVQCRPHCRFRRNYHQGRFWMWFPFWEGNRNVWRKCRGQISPYGIACPPLGFSWLRVMRLLLLPSSDLRLSLAHGCWMRLIWRGKKRTKGAVNGEEEMELGENGSDWSLRGRRDTSW